MGDEALRDELGRAGTGVRRAALPLGRRARPDRAAPAHGRAPPPPRHRAPGPRVGALRVRTLPRLLAAAARRNGVECAGAGGDRGTRKRPTSTTHPHRVDGRRTTPGRRRRPHRPPAASPGHRRARRPRRRRRPRHLPGGARRGLGRGRPAGVRRRGSQRPPVRRPVDVAVGAGRPAETLDWASAYPAAQGAGALVAVLDTGFTPGGTDQPVNLRTDLANELRPGRGRRLRRQRPRHVRHQHDRRARPTTVRAGPGSRPRRASSRSRSLAADGTGDLAVVAEGHRLRRVDRRPGDQPLAGRRRQPGPVRRPWRGRPRPPSWSPRPATTPLPFVPHALDFPAGCPGRAGGGQRRLRRQPRRRTPTPDAGLAVVAPGGDDLDLFEAGTPRLGLGRAADLRHRPGDGPLKFRYFQEEGTSMSAAEVAGEAALTVGARRRPGDGCAPAHRRHRPAAGPAGVDARPSGAERSTSPPPSPPSRRQPTSQPPIRGYRVVTAAGRVHTFS